MRVQFCTRRYFESGALISVESIAACQGCIFPLYWWQQQVENGVQLIDAQCKGIVACTVWKPGRQLMTLSEL